MKYIVLSPDQKLIGFEDSEHVLEYCLEVDNNSLDDYYIEEAKALFESKNHLKEMTCPGYIEDLLGELTPIYPSNLTEGIYFMENIDAPNDEKDNG